MSDKFLENDRVSWYKKAQYYELSDKDQAILDIFGGLVGDPRESGGDSGRGSGRIRDKSVEYQFDDVQGLAYINVWLDFWENRIAIQLYYDSEFMDNEYGKTNYVPINYENPQETTSKVNSIVESWMGGRR